ncbi:MAG: hypothetical protein WBI05_02640 [Rhodoferax sp.]|uniref:hypothetical protein n=1 Tax=Rhodoferax sp. TaxID=50421 RepID=UPI003C7679B0
MKLPWVPCATQRGPGSATSVLARHDAGQLQTRHAGNERCMKDAAGAAVADQGDLQGRRFRGVSR